MEEKELGFWVQWLHILKSRRWEILIYVLILLAIISMGFRTDWFSKTDMFALMIQVFTLIGLAGIKLTQMKQEWIRTIPDYLTVEYKHEDKIQIKAEWIPVVSLSGVREQAQAIAKALNDEKNVALYPVLHKIEHGKIIQIDCENFKHKGQAIELHKATIQLKGKLSELKNENPKTGEKSPAKLSEFGVNVDSGEYLYWSYPFKTSGLQINNSEHQSVRLVNEEEKK